MSDLISDYETDLIEHFIWGQELDPVIPLSLIFEGPLDITVKYSEKEDECYHKMYYHTHQTNGDTSNLIFINKKGEELSIQFDLMHKDDRDSVYQYSNFDIEYINFHKSE